MYLLAPFILQNFSKIFRADPEKFKKKKNLSADPEL